MSRVCLFLLKSLTLNETVPNSPDLFRLNIERVTTGNHYILQLRIGLDVGEDLFPSLEARFERILDHEFRVGTNSVVTSAVVAVCRANGHRCRIMN